MKNMKKILFGFFSMVLMSSMLTMPVSAAEQRATYDAIEVQLDQTMLAEANELGDFLSQHLTIENDQLVLAPAAETNVALYDEAQEIVVGLNNSDASFGYDADGTVILNPKEVTTSIDSFASITKASRTRLELIITPLECRIIAGMIHAGTTIHDIASAISQVFNWNLPAGAAAAVAKFVLTQFRYLFTDAGNSRGGLSIGFGLYPVGMQWISVLW